MQSNGLAAMRCWPVNVELGGEVYTIPAQPAIGWLVPIVDQDWLSIIPGLIVTDGDELDELLSEALITVKDCEHAAQDAVSVVTGMPWWVATRLALAIVGTPEVAGELVLHNVDAGVASIGALLQAVYRMIVRDADKKQRTKIDHDLVRPPDGISSRRSYDPEVAGELFEQMARSRGLPG